MRTEKNYLYSIKTVESIIANPDSSWKKLFKEMIISMIASNKNDLLWYSNKSVTLVQVDAEIKAIEKFGVRDKFIIRHGSGGTIMEPGFNNQVVRHRI